MNRSDSRLRMPSSIICLLVLIISLPIFSGKACAASSTIISNVDILPRNIVTPSDRLVVRANATSDVHIDVVNIYFNIGSAGLSFHSISDYEKDRMYLVWGSVDNGIWEYGFEKQTANTTIYFFIVAIDSTGANWSWCNFMTPFDVTVREAPPSRLAGVAFELNNIMLYSQFQEANITATVTGYIPNFPEEYWFDLDLKSNGKPVAEIPVFESANRFWYEGKECVVADLKGAPGPEGAPYDQYVMALTLTIPHRIEDLSRVDQPIRLYPREFPGWDIWDISIRSQSSERVGNNTLIHVEYLLARRVSPQYPPLLLLLTTLAVLGLNPLVSRYDRRHRYELFLTVIALTATALLSDKIKPIAGFLPNVFETLFGVQLVSTPILMAASILPATSWRMRTRNLNPEAIATLVIAAVTGGFIIYCTNLPSWAKLLSPLAEASGSFLLIGSSALRRLRRKADNQTACYYS